MPIGYVLAIIFAIVWLGFTVFERIKKSSEKREMLKKAVNTVKQYDTDIDDLIIKE